MHILRRRSTRKIESADPHQPRRGEVLWPAGDGEAGREERGEGSAAVSAGRADGLGLEHHVEQEVEAVVFRVGRLGKMAAF